MKSVLSTFHAPGSRPWESGPSTLWTAKTIPAKDIIKIAARHWLPKNGDLIVLYNNFIEDHAYLRMCDTGKENNKKGYVKSCKGSQYSVHVGRQKDGVI